MTITTTVTVVDGTSSSANPENVTGTEPNTTVAYTLDKNSRQSWMLTGLSFDNSKGQLSGVTVDPSGNTVSVLDLNTKTADIAVTVHYQSRTTSTIRGSMDPGILNRPPVAAG